MFGGIVAGRGPVLAVSEVEGAALRLTIDVSVLPRAVGHGESVSVSGVCLTVVTSGPESAHSAPADHPGRMIATFDVIGETLRCTTLGALAAGDLVNLEASLRVGDPIGGHEVQGHVDAVGKVVEIETRSDETWMTIACPPVVHDTLVPKGWIAVDGASLTVAALGSDRFSVALIPTTLALTSLGDARPGTLVNLEGDPLGRHVARWMAARGLARGEQFSMQRGRERSTRVAGDAR